MLSLFQGIAGGVDTRQQKDPTTPAVCFLLTKQTNMWSGCCQLLGIGRLGKVLPWIGTPPKPQDAIVEDP